MTCHAADVIGVSAANGIEVCATAEIQPAVHCRFSFQIYAAMNHADGMLVCGKADRAYRLFLAP